MMKHASYVVGVDLGGTNMQAAVLDQHDAIVARSHMRTHPERGVDAVIGSLISCVDAALDAANLARDAVHAVGIAAPGAINVTTGEVIAAPNLQWKNVPLRDLLSERLQRPVVVDNDVNAAAWGEFCVGAAQPYASAMAVWVGTGVGGGLILDGKLYRGTSHSAGEIGQTVVGPGGRAAKNIMEHHVSRVGMTRLCKLWASEHPTSSLTAAISDLEDENVQHISLTTVANALANGDDLAKRLIDHAAAHLGVAIANCVTLLGLDAIVLGGGAIEKLGDAIMPPTHAVFRESVFPAQARNIPFVQSQLTSDAGTTGAALLSRAEATR